MPGLTLADPRLLWLLAVLPVLALWLYRRRASPPALKFPLTSRLGAVPKSLRTRAQWLLPLLPILSVAFAVVALARPQAEGETRRQERHVEGMDLAVALDLSASMQATDLAPKNRLEVAKSVLWDFLERRERDRVSLVAFAGVAYTQAPLTLDHRAVQSVLSTLKAGVLEDGTAIGDAIGTGLNRLRESEAKSRALVLITDGDNNAGRLSPLDAAKLAKELGIPVFPILVGKGGVAQMPVGRSPTGEPVYAQVEAPVNAELLEQLARETGGRFFRATDRAGLEEGLQAVLDKMERSELADGGATSTPDERFTGFLSASLLLAGLDVLLRATLLKVSP